MLGTILYQGNGTTGGIKHMGMHNISENGRGEWVALCGHYTHTDTDTHNIQELQHM
jgi:hypothetical protein